MRIEALLSEADRLHSAGREQAAWQRILKALELAPCDPAAVERATGIAVERGRFDDALRLWSRLKETTPDDVHVCERIEILKRMVISNRPVVDKEALQTYRGHRNARRPDREHADAGIRWILEAQTAAGDGGVSALYDIGLSRWQVSYPETTGYIIPTLLAWHHLTSDGDALTAARVMGDWQIEIQSPDGGTGEPVGVCLLKPRVFNTSQVILGWLALHRQTGDGRYLDAARRAADWIVALQEADGSWTRFTYAGPKAHKVRVGWALLELDAVTPCEAHREAALRSVAWTLRLANDEGWFANASLTEPDRPWTHLIGYVLVGLLEACRMAGDRMDRRQAMVALGAAARRLVERIETLDDAAVGVPGALDPVWDGDGRWSCITGNVQIAFFLRRFAEATGDSRAADAADRLVEGAKTVQFLDGVEDKNVLGGLPGSYPIDGFYAAGSIPNWGVKFFVDALLQRMLPQDAQYCLG
ncbi:hypothetical protein GAY31_09410 [Azospirillum brasilense]|nr:hypothetical protein [Azospirillum brasilense]